jgi:hypothetical protein
MAIWSDRSPDPVTCDWCGEPIPAGQLILIEEDGACRHDRTHQPGCTYTRYLERHYALPPQQQTGALQPASGRVAEPTKRCTECGRTRPRADFHRNGSSRAGTPSVAGRCRDCVNAQKRQRYTQDPSAARRATQEWAQRNPELARVRNREYGRRSRERRRQKKEQGG